MGDAVELVNRQGALASVPEGQSLDFVGLDEDVLGMPIEHKSVYRLDLAGGDGGTGLQIVQDDLAGFVGVVDAVVGTDRGAVAAGDFERDTRQRLVCRALDEFPYDQRCRWIIVEGETVGDAGAHDNAFRHFILDIASGCAAFSDDYRGVRLQAGNDDRAVPARGEAPVVAADLGAVAVFDSELRAGKALLGHGVALQNGQCAERIVGHGDLLRIRGAHNDGFRVCRQLVVSRRPSLRDDVGRGRELREINLSVLIRRVQTVGARQALVVVEICPVCRRDAELRAGQRLPRDAVQLLHDEGALGLVGDA